MLENKQINIIIFFYNNYLKPEFGDVLLLGSASSLIFDEEDSNFLLKAQEI